VGCDPWNNLSSWLCVALLFPTLVPKIQYKHIKKEITKCLWLEAKKIIKLMTKWFICSRKYCLCFRFFRSFSFCTCLAVQELNPSRNNSCGEFKETEDMWNWLRLHRSAVIKRCPALVTHRLRMFLYYTKMAGF